MSGIYVGTPDGVKELQLAGGPNKVSGSQTFTESGTFTVPEGVSRIDITIVGGGSSAGFKYGTFTATIITTVNGVAVTEGFSGYVKKVFQYPVREGENHTIVVGSGGRFRVSALKYGDSGLESGKWYMSTAKDYKMNHVIGGDSKFDNIIAYGGGRYVTDYADSFSASEFEDDFTRSNVDRLAFQHYSSDIPKSYIYYTSGTSKPDFAVRTYNGYTILGDFPGNINNKGELNTGIDSGGSYIILNDSASGKPGWVTITW